MANSSSVNTFNINRDELIRIIEENSNESSKILATHIIILREEIQNIKDTVDSIKTMIQIGLTVIGILLSIIAILGYIKLR